MHGWSQVVLGDGPAVKSSVLCRTGEGLGEARKKGSLSSLSSLSGNLEIWPLLMILLLLSPACAVVGGQVNFSGDLSGFPVNRTNER